MNRELLEKLDDIMDMLHLMEDNQVMLFREIMELREEVQEIRDSEDL